MKKNIFIVLMVFTTALSLSAHSLIMMVNDEGDGNVLIRGEFNTGQVAAGATVRLTSLQNGSVLFEKRLPEEGEMIVKIPDIPYEIILDGGPGHTRTQEGIAPPGGFKTPKGADVVAVHQEKVSDSCQASQILWALNILTFGWVLYFGLRNIIRLKTQGQESAECSSL